MENENDKLSCLETGLCFLIPLLGLIIYLREPNPSGKAAGKAALLGTLCFVIYFLIYFFIG